jgi:hypothetical protein
MPITERAQNLHMRRSLGCHREPQEHLVVPMAVFSTIANGSSDPRTQRALLRSAAADALLQQASVPATLPSATGGLNLSAAEDVAAPHSEDQSSFRPDRRLMAAAAALAGGACSGPAERKMVPCVVSREQLLSGHRSFTLLHCASVAMGSAPWLRLTPRLTYPASALCMSSSSGAVPAIFVCHSSGIAAGGL